MRRSIAMLIASALASAGAGVVAQGSTQWRTAPSEGRFRATATADAAREMDAFARCIVNRRYDRALALVLAPYASVEQEAASKKIVMRSEDPCLTGTFSETRMRFSGQVLAGALAQAMVLKDYPDLPAVIRSVEVVPAEENAKMAKLNVAEIFGRCIVQRDPAAALAMFSPVGGSAGEQRAFDMLRDDLGPCLAAGSTLRVNKMFVRNVTGVAAYRLAHEIRPRGRLQAALSGPTR